ncbi:MAG TPA: formimidoylglutamate deiminase [Burkholderiales bacterium]|nr:formimidoylglutamate deiminase [Burkholderiales bacterium]
MKKYFARDALLPSGWARDVSISVDEDGSIASVEADTGGERLRGAVLPGMANLHSHAFQRGMAGLAEVRGAPDDDFWTWRELMYRFVERVTPDQAEAIARQLYIEMLKHGYTAVAEFNYLNQPAEMMARHIAAAADAGIAITALPSLYRWANFDSQPLRPRQKRFDSDVRGIVDAFDAVKRTPDLRAGVAPHSLRAVDPGALRELVSALPADAPIHIHAAEQTKEVEECRLALGQRPVEWLLSNFALDERWCLVHATHMVEDEVRGLARSGAVAGLCPTTEGNLGDGVFPLLEYRAAGGRYGIGGDSHVSRDPAEELRLLEYVQRLVARKRNRVVGKSAAVGTTLWLEAAAGGAQAMGRAMGAIAPGKRADLVVLETEERGDTAANTFIFGGTTALVRDVMVAGHWVVEHRHHRLEESAARAFSQAVKPLVA